MNLGLLIGLKRLLSPFFKRWFLRLNWLFEEQPLQQGAKSVEHSLRADITALIKRCCQEFIALTKTRRAAVPRVASDVMTSSLSRSMKVRASLEA